MSGSDEPSLRSGSAQSTDRETAYPIPQSNALRQVDRKSLQELFSIDPEALGDSLMDVIVHMQELRDRLAATETVRQVRVKKDPSARAPAIPRQTKIVTSAAQLGLVRKPH